MIGLQKGEIESKFLQAVRRQNVKIDEITLQALARSVAEIFDSNNEKIEQDLRTRLESYNN